MILYGFRNKKKKKIRPRDEDKLELNETKRSLRTLFLYTRYFDGHSCLGVEPSPLELEHTRSTSLNPVTPISNLKKVWNWNSFPPILAAKSGKYTLSAKQY